MTFQDAIQTLRRLGLTFNQARVYLALARSGTSTAKTISTVSQIPREDVYRIMPQLRRLGLVEKAVVVPAKFKALSMEEALFVLLQRRMEETSELRTKAGELLKNFRQNIAKQNLEEEEPQFILIPERENALQRRRMATNNAQRSLVDVTSWKRFPNGLYTYAEEVEKALDRGVEIRFVTDQPEGKGSIPKIKKDKKYRLVVAAASKGYPGDYSKVIGKKIIGFENLQKKAIVFGAGAKYENKKWQAAGGRLFYVLGEGQNVAQARKMAYNALSLVDVEGNNLHYRRDIGYRDLERLHKLG